jgi:hypothetical protein
MIYLQSSPKYRGYLRQLSAKEKVNAIYQHGQKVARAAREKAEEIELKLHYENWQSDLPKLYMDTYVLRQKIHAQKYRELRGIE